MSEEEEFLLEAEIQGISGSLLPLLVIQGKKVPRTWDS